MEGQGDEEEHSKMSILLVSNGDVDLKTIQILKDDLKRVFNKVVEIGKGLSEPHYATIKSEASITRLRQEFYGLPADHTLFQRRVLTEAVHELGHTYGLGHRKNPGCVMFFSNSLIDTDRKGSEFCPKCKNKLL